MKLLALPTLPEELEPPPPGLGTLGPWLHALARTQGSWPPAVPTLTAAPEVCGWAAGVEAADRLADSGAGLVVVRGGSAAGPALAVLAVLLRLDPAAAVGTAGGPDWADLVAQVREGLRTAKGFVGDPAGLVTALGAGPVAGIAGLVAQSAARRTPVLLGPAADAVAGAVLAARIAAASSAWVLGSSSAPGGAASLGLADLGCPVLVDLRVTLGLDLALAVLGPAVGLTARG